MGVLSTVPFFRFGLPTRPLAAPGICNGTLVACVQLESSLPLLPIYVGGPSATRYCWVEGVLVI